MVIITTNFGPIKVKLHDEDAPETVANFLKYVDAEFYDDTIFHRVIDGFMVQGGGFQTGMKQKPTKKPVKNEADKAKKNKRGTLAMARTMDPHSATAQFFINHKDNDFLDHRSKDMQGWGYCVFGEVEEGMDVVDNIAKTKTGSKGGHQDVPVKDVVIESIRVAK